MCKVNVIKDDKCSKLRSERQINFETKLIMNIETAQEFDSRRPEENPIFFL